MFEKLFKARVTKYIKRIPKPSGKGWIYFYTNKQIKDYKEKGIIPGDKKEKEEKSSWVNNFASFFGFTSKKEVMQKVESDYKEKQVAEKYSLTWSDWKTHVSEYFSNKNKWDNLFKKKLEAQKEVIKNTNKKEALKKEFSAEKKIKEKTIKDRLNLRIMYLIFNTYSKGEENGINRNTTNGTGNRPGELSTDNKEIRTGGIKPDPLSNVPEKQPSNNRKIDVLAGSVSGERPGRDVRLTPSQIKATRQAVLDLLESKTNEEMTDEDKALLRQYEGAGGLKEENKTDTATLYEYYTPRPVVSKMWDLVKKYLGEGPQVVLEPSAGIGRFAENQPEDYDFTMLELDPVSSRINSILFPDAEIRNKPFEQMFMKGGVSQKEYNGKKFSVVIGNPPYGSYNSIEKGLGEGEKHTRYEEYFIDRGLDALEEGGVMAYIVPSGFLRDNKFDEIKSKIASKGKLLEAYRLPNGTFQTTGVGTDIIVLRKEKGNIDDFLDDKYFKDNPENIMGEQTTRSGQYGKQEQYVALKPGDTFDGIIDNIKIDAVPVVPVGQPSQKKQIKEKVKTTYPKTNKNKSVKKDAEDNFETMPDVETDTMESFNKKYNKQFSPGDLKIWENTNYDGKVDISKLSEKEKNELKGNENICIDSNGDYFHKTNYVSGNIYDRLNDLEIARDSIGEIRYKAQKDMLESALPEYKTTKNFFVSPISDFAKNFEFSDPDTGEKKEFIKRFFEWATGGNSSYRMNWEGGVTQHDLPSGVSWSDIVDYIDQVPVKTSRSGDKVNAKYMAEKTKELRRDIAEKLVKRFIETGLVKDEQTQLEKTYNNTFNAYVAPDYAQVPLFLEGISTKFKGHDLTVTSQQIKGASFLGNKGNGSLAYDVGVGKTITGILATVSQLQTGRSKKPVICVPKAVYRENWIKEIKELFPNIKINELGNLGSKALKGKMPEIEDGSISIITYEALSNITFKDETIHGGLLDDMVASQQSTKEKMSDREKSANREKIMTLLGKSIKAKSEVLTSGIKFNEVNITNKEGFKKYNGSSIDPKKIMAAYDISGKKAILIKDGREWAVVDIQSGINISKGGNRTDVMNLLFSTLDNYSEDKYKELINNKGIANSDKENNFETMPEDEETETGSFYFEDLGFDHITIDEVHNFKNIFATAHPNQKTNDSGKAEQTANEFQGLTGSQSNRGLKMFAITQLIQENNDDRNIYSLSATPFTNSPLEIYNILALHARKKLKKLGIYNLHEFMAQFAKLKTEWAVDARGNIEKKSVMKEFQNLSALQSLIREYIDKVDGEEAGIERPVKNTHIAELEMSALQKAIYAIEMTRFDLKDARGMPMPGATLVAINNMRQVSISPGAIKFDELYNGTGIPELVAKDDYVEDSPKLKFTTDSIAQLYDQRPDVGQVMYMPRGVEQYNKVIDNLVKKGIPREAIATIASKTSDDNKGKIMSSFNDPNGKIKVVIGSETIKEGVNLNGNTATIYNTLLGWNPTETTQVEGRAWRQGNKQGNVHVVYPQLIDSVDSTMYQKHDEKSQRLAQIFSYKGDSLNVEDISPEEVKFDLIKDPEKRAKFEMDLKLEKIEDQMREKRIFIDTLNKYKSDFDGSESKLSEFDDTIKKYIEDVVDAEKDLQESEQELKDYKKAHSKKEDGYVTEVSSLETSVQSGKRKVSDEKRYVKDVEREKKMAIQKVDGIKAKMNDMGIDISKIDDKVATEQAMVSELHQETVSIKNDKEVYIEKAKAEIKARQRDVMPKLSDVVNNNVAVIAGNLKSFAAVKEAGELNKNKFFKNSEIQGEKSMQKAFFSKRFNPETHEFEYRRL